MLRSKLLYAGLRARGPLIAGGTAAALLIANSQNQSPADCAFWSGKPKVHLRYFKIGGVAEVRG